MSLSHPPSGVRSTQAFILAGGRSDRMGRDKALVEFEGKPLIWHALELLRSLDFEPHVAGARSDLSSFAPVLPDDSSLPGCGPLSGICAALRSITSRFALFLPVDMPLIPSSLIEYLLHHAEVTESAVTIASLSGFLETFPVVLDRAAAPFLQASLESRDRNCLAAFRTAATSLQRPFSSVPAELLLQAGQISHPRFLPPEAWFLSINTPSDLVRAQSLRAHALRLS